MANVTNDTMAETMENNYTKLAERLDIIEDDVKVIKDALLGNSFSENQGWVHKVKQLNDRVDKLENLVKNGKGMLIGLSIGTGGLLFKIIEEILKSLS